MPDREFPRDPSQREQHEQHEQHERPDQHGPAGAAPRAPGAPGALPPPPATHLGLLGTGVVLSPLRSRNGAETAAERRRRRAEFLRDLTEARELRARVHPRRTKAARLRHEMLMRTFRY
jgi:hypothetical protein